MSLVKQPDLARTLDAIAATGGEDFYIGETAKEMVRAIRADGGLWTMEDLASYVVKERAPIDGAYRGYGIHSMGPPSSGGVLLVQMLGVLEQFDRAIDGGAALVSRDPPHLGDEVQEGPDAHVDVEGVGLG